MSRSEPLCTSRLLFDLIHASDTKRLRALLQAKIEPLEEVLNEAGYTPLAWAASLGRLACVSQLLQAGASTITLTVRGETPLTCAVKTGNNLDVVRLLFEYQEIGARWSAFYSVDHAGLSALDYARRGPPVVFSYLLDMERSTALGTSPLHWPWHRMSRRPMSR